MANFLLGALCGWFLHYIYSVKKKKPNINGPKDPGMNFHDAE